MPDTGEAVRLLVYLSGNVRKGIDDTRSADAFWSEDDEERLRRGVSRVPLTLLNPARYPMRRADPRANFGCDLHLVRTSDAVVVDARAERGIGVGAEMMFARYAGTAVITVCPPNTFYRRDVVRGVDGEDLIDWVHPFVASLSDEVVDTVEEAAASLDRLATVGPMRRPRLPPVEDAIAYYLRTLEIDRG